MLGAGAEVVLVVEADADPGGDPAAAALALVGRGLRDALHRQALDLGAMAVAADTGEAGIDDVVDARHRQRGLGDIGRQHHPAAPVRLEHPRLLGRPLAGEQRQYLGRGRMLLAQGLGGLADLALAGEEDEHIAWTLARQLGDGIGDPLLHRLVALAGMLLLGRAVADLDRIGAPGDADDRRRGAVRRGEMLGEALRVDGR